MIILQSPFHEERLFSLLSLVERFSRGDEKQRALIYRQYLKHRQYINNWDLVDSSAPYIMGAHLADKDRQPLYKLAKSRNLWERRISIIATFSLIRKGDFTDTLAISHLLLNDPEDLIHMKNFHKKKESVI